MQVKVKSGTKFIKFSIRIFNMLLAIAELKYAYDMTDAADEIIPNILAHKSIFNN